jgi:hypothetical protein
MSIYQTLTTSLIAAVSLSACGLETPLTLGEAQDAKDESALATEVSALVAGDVELQTGVTLGDRAETALEAYRAFYESQIPCADVGLMDQTLSVTFGAEGTCTWQGKTWTGTRTIKVVDFSADEAHLQHGWAEVSNGSVTVSGTADVTWTPSEDSVVERRVEHELTWSKVGVEGERVGTGSRVQTLIDPSQGIAGGIEINGNRSWTSPKGLWDMSIEKAQLRPQDPLPQSGVYEIVNPKEKTLRLEFSRVDDNTINVEVTAGKISFDFDVSKPAQ